MMPFTWNMQMYNGVPHLIYWFIPLFIVEMILKGYALWKAARNNEPVWFVALLVLNTLGILPAIYLLWFQKKQQESTA